MNIHKRLLNDMFRTVSLSRHDFEEINVIKTKWAQKSEYLLNTNYFDKSIRELVKRFLHFFQFSDT